MKSCCTKLTILTVYPSSESLQVYDFAKGLQGKTMSRRAGIIFPFMPATLADVRFPLQSPLHVCLHGILAVLQYTSLSPLTLQQRLDLML